MILTCPKCASRYFLDDARVGPKGRTVRCASCAEAWRVEPPEPAAGAEAPLPLSRPTMTVALPSEPGEPPRAAPLPERIRAEALEKKRSREAVAAGVAWASLAAGFVVLVLGAVLFRVDVVRLWPKTAGAYAFARMPVNPTGLSIDTVQGQTTLIGGHAALSVTGAERNVETAPRPFMPLRVILYDKDGHRLTSAVYAPPTVQIPPGDTHPFAVNFIDPPGALSNFVVEFAFDKTPTPPKPAAPIRRPAAPVRGAPSPPLAQAREAPLPLQPIVPALKAHDATPLPADSPYALPPSAMQPPAR